MTEGTMRPSEGLTKRLRDEATARLEELARLRERELAAKALLVEFYDLLLKGDVKFVGSLQGGIWTLPDRVKEVIYGHK